jgi:hypothetical protein
MPNRREFISALAAYPLAARLARAEPYRPSMVVYDPAFPDSAAFAAEAVRRGATVHAIGSDAGSVWMNQIEPRWRRGPAVVAGLTSRADLFCLEFLARDYGMRAVYRAQHSLIAAGRCWSVAAAGMVMNGPAALDPDFGLGLLDLAEPAKTAGPSLFSWVIGPGRRSGVLGG